jgi:hypothetical protein
MSIKTNDPRIDAALNSALNSYPLEPTPASLRRKVMDQVRRETMAQRRQPPAPVKFRLSVFDFLVPALIALLLSTPFPLLLWGVSTLDPLALPRLRLELLAALQALLFSPWLLPALVGALMIGFTVMVILAAALILPGRIEWQPASGD